MEGIEYYRVLAEHFCNELINEEGWLAVSKYLAGKGRRDVADAINHGIERANGDISVKFNYIAMGLSKVLEIDTSQPLEEFKKRVRDMPNHKVI